MKEWKRLVYYLVINILVSAITTLAVLYFWDRTHPPVLEGVQPGAVSALGSEGQPVSATQPISGTLQAAGPALTATPTRDPYENAIAYKAKADDTLGDIANKFDVPLEELLAYNGLKDGNALSIGQVIYIPVTPEPGSTEAPNPQQTAAPQVTGTPAGTPQPARVIINSVIGPGDLASERVFLTRTGDAPLSLAGWRLDDGNGNVFTFPQLELYKDGAVNVWTTTGSPTVVDLYWGRSSPVWQSGATVTLKDSQGKVQSTYKIP